MTYAFLDIVAFSRDKNIPPDFSRRMFSSNSGDRADALAEYVFTVVTNGNSDAGKFLRGICGTNDDLCYKNFKALVLSLKDTTSMQQYFNSPAGNAFLVTVDGRVTQYFSQQLGIKLPSGIFTGIYVWGEQGFKGSAFNVDGFCGSKSVNDPSLGGKCTGIIGIPIGKVLENYGEGLVYNWADQQMGLKPGTTAKVVTIYQLIDKSQKVTGLAKDKLKVQAAQLISALVVSYFSQDFSTFDKAAQLPAGTTSLLAGALVTYGSSLLLGLSGSAATAAAFGPAFFLYLGVVLFTGVTSVQVTVLATGDGYYPFYSSLNYFGHGEAGRAPYAEANVHDPPTGTFDASKNLDYRNGLKRVARAKVRGLLLDILRMPSSDWAAKHVPDPKTLWASQVFTYGGSGAEYDPLTDPIITSYINQNTPFDPTNPGWGYGSEDSRCDSTTVNSDGTVTCTRKDSQLAGFYGLPTLTNAVHIRW